MHILIRFLLSTLDTTKEILQYVVFFQRQSGCILTRLHRDGGRDFFTAQSKLRKKGVAITTSARYTPASNGLVERMQGVPMSIALTSLAQSWLPLNDCPYVVEHAISCKNVVKHATTENIPTRVAL